MAPVGNQIPVTGVHGPRQLSVDIDKGVVILEVPDKAGHGTMWRFLNHYSGVLRKYFGMNKIEAESRVRANSGIGNKIWFFLCSQSIFTFISRSVDVNTSDTES